MKKKSRKSIKEMMYGKAKSAKEMAYGSGNVLDSLKEAVDEVQKDRDRKRKGKE